jgi:hypothetical protein
MAETKLVPELKTIKLSDVVFDPVVYPRHDHDPVLVQRYAGVMEQIEADQKFLCVSADLKLLDGKHRWLAYRKAFGDDGAADREIKVLVYPVTQAHDQLRLAIRLNSKHGAQLSDVDKEEDAKTLYSYGLNYEEIAADLSVGKAKVGEWLSRTVKENKEKRNKKIFDLWLACYTQEEIAAEVGCSRDVAQAESEKFVETVLQNQIHKPVAAHSIDFEIPLYNVWKQQEKTPGSGHFGNSEARWVDNLLYLYTQPFDIVVDPCAGGGSTIEICKKRFRRYWVSDRKPVVEREHEIRRHDLTDGLPPLPRWQDVKLVYLDPPYWKQAEGQYSNNPTDLANMPLEQFSETLVGIINGFAKKLKPGAVIALLMQPTQWKAPERIYTDHVADMIRLIKLPIDMRVQCPYESQQCNAQMVDWAKENRKVLVLSRELVIWRIE